MLLNRLAIFLLCLLLIIGNRIDAAETQPTLADATLHTGHSKVDVVMNVGTPIDAVDESEKTALMLAASKGDIATVLALIEKQADVNRADREGVTALMYAAQKGEAAVVIALLEAGARPDSVDKKGRGVLWYAQKSPASANILGILLEYGVPQAEEKVHGFADADVKLPQEVTVHFATNRVATGDKVDPEKFYGDKPGTLSYGVCRVSIPEQHLEGELESPVILVGKFDPAKHVTLLEVVPQNEHDFFRALKERQKTGSSRDLLVFVHGYNVSFGKAARRTAQLAFDLDFPGTPVLFSWPSAQKLFDYAGDRERIVESVPKFKEFLLKMIDKFQPDNVHLVAHSMGTYGLTLALNEVSEELARRKSGPVFNQIILAAPDIDAEQFRTNIAPKISKTAKRVTVYASSGDLAMAVSRHYNAKGHRAGDSDPEVIVVAGAESVDVSQVDTSLVGHSYYGSNMTVLDDIRRVILGQAPQERHLETRGASKTQRGYWFLNPPKSNDPGAPPGKL